MRLVRTAILAAVLWKPSEKAYSQPADMIFIAPSNYVMPMANFKDRELTAGVLKDLGESIAAAVGRHARFIKLPPKRVGPYLSLGLADGLCYALPEWVGGGHNWSVSFIADSTIILARAILPEEDDVTNFAYAPVGTILGYKYPEIERKLGPGFVRDDSDGIDMIIEKMLHDRIRFGIVERSMWENFSAAKNLRDIYQVGTISNFSAGCAFSKNSSIPFSDVDHAIQTLLKDGSISRILTQYGLSTVANCPVQTTMHGEEANAKFQKKYLKKQP